MPRIHLPGISRATGFTFGALAVDETAKTFAQLDAFEEACRRLCRYCDNGIPLIAIEGGSVKHDSEDLDEHCHAWIVRQLQMEIGGFRERTSEIPVPTDEFFRLWESPRPPARRFPR